jgi:hypothetical protein
LEGRPILVGGPPDLAAGRPRWRQGGPLTTYGRFDHLPDTGSYRVTWPTRRYTSTQPPPTHASAGVEGPPQDPAPLVEEVGTARAK